MNDDANASGTHTSARLDSQYDPTAIESRWYEFWEDNGLFSPADEADAAEPYCIMLPPPNVTGSLHMGHAFQDTIMDTLSRFQRLRGRDVLWQAGTDHAGIATQMVVERQLSAEGESRHQLGREKFMDRVWDWKESSGGRIEQQMRRLGTSVDWPTARFTMDEGLSEAVTRVFETLYDEGLIYRGKRLVNWDPVLNTALSDLEVLSQEESGKLWHIRYPHAVGDGHVVIATTRPETLLGDAAVAVHPDDERYTDLVGQRLQLPLCDREIPVIADEYVDPEFGTGCVKITPAHDFNDFEVGERHDLPLINILNANASISDEAPERYQGMDRFEARKQIVADLEAAGLLEKIDDHSLKVPRGDRSGAVVEPWLTDQWYVKIEPLAAPARDAVRDGRIRFVPENWDKTYFAWMDNIQDWCISRQLWWGHRIPAWYDDDGQVYVGRSEAAVRKKYGDQLSAGDTLRQDEDVLDTWFSSALWPFSTLGWPENTERLQRFYPTDVLVTGFDIIFFWVARMIMFGLKFMDDVPFHTVYIHGLIRDGQGQKMSKSKGNVLDPIDLIDGISLDDLVEKRTAGLMQPHMAPAIEKATRSEFPEGIPAFGTDALRFTFASLATTGRDIRFDLGRIEGYRNFCNKIWNATRYVLMQLGDSDQPAAAQSTGATGVAERWIYSRLVRTVTEVEQSLQNYRLDLASQALYEFFWNEYCDWYLELTKPALKSAQGDERNAILYTLLDVLEQALRLLHPIMPFITEEIWQRIAPVLGREGLSISTQSWPSPGEDEVDEEAEAQVAWLQAVLLEIRRIRSELGVSPGKPVDVLLDDGSASDRAMLESLQPLLTALGRIDSIGWLEDDRKAPASASGLAGELKILVPLAGLIDMKAELDRLRQQLKAARSDQQISEKKLGNQKFVDNAPPAVVAQERERLKTHSVRVSKLTEQIETMEAAAVSQQQPD